MNPIDVIIPSIFTPHTGGESVCQVDAMTVGEAIERLLVVHPKLAPVLMDDEHKPLGYLQIFVNEDNIRDLAGLATRLQPRDELLIIPAIAGG